MSEEHPSSTLDPPHGDVPFLPPELHPSADRIRSNMRRSEEGIAQILAEKSATVPPADLVEFRPVPQGETDAMLMLPQPVKRKRGRPTRVQLRIEPRHPRKYVQLTPEMRRLLRADHEDGKTNRELAEKYNISTSTVSAIINEPAPPKPRGGAVYERITPQASKIMADLIVEDPTVTAKELSDAVKNVCAKQPAVSSICHHLRSERMVQHGCPVFSMKRLRVHQDERASDATKEQRKEYVKRFITLDEEGRMFIYIDETGFQALELLKRGRSPVGTRCISHRRKVKTDTVTAITAISEVYGVVHVTFVEGSVNEQVFQVFLLSLMEKLQQFTKEPFVFVMDNVGFHKTEDVKETIRDRNYSILYTAPNSCELNPIEYVFGIWKSRLRIPLTVRTQRELTDFLSESLNLLQRVDVDRCVKMVKYHLLPLAAEKSDLSLVDGLRRTADPTVIDDDAGVDRGAMIVRRGPLLGAASAADDYAPDWEEETMGSSTSTDGAPSSASMTEPGPATSSASSSVLATGTVSEPD